MVTSRFDGTSEPDLPQNASGPIGFQGRFAWSGPRRGGRFRRTMAAIRLPTPPNTVSPAYRRIYAVVRRIPHGRVATYGQVAVKAGLPGRARQVGYALHALPAGSRVPWHRVINARGRISLRSRPGPELSQRMLLEREGVRFDAGGAVDLRRFGWGRRRPRSAAAP